MLVEVLQSIPKYVKVLNLKGLLVVYRNQSEIQNDNSDSVVLKM